MSQTLARALVFATSASVLILEILAVRLLAPYLGVSLEVFTGIIGVILAGISAGAWAGGRAADRADPPRLLGPLLVVGGLTAVASPLIVDLVGSAVASGALSIVVITTLGFFAPAAVLSAVPPVVVKIRLASLAETGSVVGSYSAIGTAGALVGTFVTGFVLIAAFPTRPIVFAVGALLTAAGLILWVSRRSSAVSTVLVLVLLGGLLVVFDGPCQYETAYHCAIVVADDLRTTGRLLVLDTGHHSYVDIEDPTHLEFRYIRVMADVINLELPPGPLAAVHIGGGGFTMPGYLSATRPGGENTILEIDGKLVEIGTTHLALDDPSDVIVDDARRSIETVPLGSVDLAIGDAFSGFSVPWHLTTVEFIEKVAARLRPGGIYTINVIDYPDLAFARSEASALLEVFEHVTVFAPDGYLAGNGGGNFVMVASDQPIDVAGIEAAISARGGVESGLGAEEVRAFASGARPLFDDFAPVDQLINRP